MRYVIPILLLLTACRSYDRPEEVVVHSSMYGTTIPFAVHRLHEEFDCELLRIVPQQDSDWSGRWPDRGRVTVQKIPLEDVPEHVEPHIKAGHVGWLEYPLPRRNRGRIFFLEGYDVTELDVMHELAHVIVIDKGHYGASGLLGEEETSHEVSEELRRDVEERCL